MNEETQHSQVNYSKEFLQAILDKLKLGDKRSIHLNAVPGRYATRLDLHKLSQLPGDVHNKFLETLLSQEKFEFKIDFEKVDMSEIDEDEKQALALLAKRLTGMAVEAEDQFLEFGTKNFGIGYPILVRRDKADPSKLIKAPVVIWKLDITRSKRKANEWTITRSEGAPIIVNDLLRNHIEKDGSVKIDSFDEAVLEDGVIDGGELAEFCTNLLGQINTEEPKPIEQSALVTQACPASSSDFDALAKDEGWYQWSAIFGLYKARKEPIIQRAEEMLADLEDWDGEDLVLEKFRTSTVSSVDTDPSKEEIINTLTDKEFKTIQGPPGTGKSQALTAIITNVLQNEGRCLVVCEKKTALDVIYDNLKKVGLEHLCAVVDDVNEDRKKIVKIAREKFEHAASYHNASAFTRKLNQFKALRDEVNESLRRSSRTIFGEESWKEILGHYLRLSKLQGFNVLKERVSGEAFEFTHEELDQKLQTLNTAESLVRFLSPSDKLLEQNLNESSYREKYVVATRVDAERKIKDASTRIRELLEYVKGIDGSTTKHAGISVFNEQGLNNRIAATRELRKAAEALENICIEAETSPFLNNKNRNKVGVEFGLHFSAIFSGKAKEWKMLKERLAVKFRGFQILTKRNKWFAAEPCVSEVLNSKQNIGILVTCIRASREGIDEVLARYESLSKIRATALELENRYNATLLDPVSQRPLPGVKDCDDWLGYLKSIQETADLFASLEDAITNYQHYHSWRHFRDYSCTEGDRRLIDWLIGLNVKNWGDVFSGTYYYALLLEREEGGGIPDMESALQKLSGMDAELQEMQPQLIEGIWARKMHDARADFERRNRYDAKILYNLRKNNIHAKTKRLREIIETDFDLFTSTFPILLVNPVVADSILPLKQGLFEIVLFDEASQLRIEDTFTSMIRGKYKIVAGDKHQMPPSNYFQAEANIHLDEVSEELKDVEGENAVDEVGNTGVSKEAIMEQALSDSLLGYVELMPESARKASYLDYHYRSRHAALIEFSNQAFYGGNLTTVVPEQDYVPIELHHVGGEFIDKTNVQEAQCVLSVLDQMNPNADGKYPSVGIATFNLPQRNLIIDLINELCVDDNDFAKRMEGIREAGFFVKNLENIQGDEKDVIIVSTTYGLDKSGRFLERLGPVNQGKGYQLLNVIVTRARHKLYVCTSIPRERYMAFGEHLERLGNQKKAILYAYLAYADAISRRDSEASNNVLKALHERTHDNPRTPAAMGAVESPFEQEVYEMLAERFPEDSIQVQKKVAGFRIDFVVSLEGKPAVAIECDGKTYHSSNEAYAHDKYRQRELENMGYIVYRIWSTDWWHDRDREFSKLREFLERNL